MSSDTSFVAFPATESSPKHVQPVRGSHLPFRRISLPTAPTGLHRQSVVSVASFDSLPEDGESSPIRGLPRSPNGRTRPISVESPRRRNRRRDTSVKPTDDAARAAKRRKIIDEFHETEKAYVAGLEMIYSHFLVPILSSLDTPEPLLNRATLTSTFSNFIDIWNFHRSFLSALTSLLETSKATPPPLSSLLLSHFPYLSLYNPFITSFPSTISSLTDLATPPTSTRPNPQYNSAFAAFLQRQEADPRCGKLKLRDWLLTIVQRCPRYLLLLKDLINATDSGDPEHAPLSEAHGLVSKITLALNAALHTHAQTLSLLALQRSTSGLPFQLISPGRTLVKRGSVMQAERSTPPRPREFLLFSDCLIWLESTDAANNSWDWDWNLSSAWSGSGSGGATSEEGPTSQPKPIPPSRSRSKSEAEILQAGRSSSSIDLSSPSTSASPSKPYQRKSYQPTPPVLLPPPPSMVKRRAANSSTEEKWTFKGCVELVDLEVTVGSVLGEERRFEILSPEESFVVYAASEEERTEWVSSIRQAKEQLLATLNVTNPNSTLTSSASTNHVRRSLQALPFHPSDDRLATIRGHAGAKSPAKKAKAAKKEREKERKDNAERRRKVEHWVPPVWIPDGKTNECMRCSKLFGWRRRRHHCRLCGRCVCSACSGRTFFIADATGKADATKPARACDACYETVFPVVDPAPLTSSQPTEQEQRGNDAIPSLSNLPSWLSMPSIPTKPHALMAIDLDYGPDTSLDAADVAWAAGEREGWVSREGRGVVRLKPHQRLKSYHQILEDFEAHGEEVLLESAVEPEEENDESAVNDGHYYPDEREEEAREQEREREPEVDELDDVAEMDEEEARDEYPHLFFTPPVSLASSPVSSPRKRKEDTARRSKRFSLPAVALHTTSVMARASMVVEDDPDVTGTPDSTTPTRPRRYSLVLSPGKSAMQSRGLSDPVKEEDEDGSGAVKSLAANKLSELLNRNLRTRD